MYFGFSFWVSFHSCILFRLRKIKIFNSFKTELSNYLINNATSIPAQIRLWLTIVRVYKLYLLTYLLTKSCVYYKLYLGYCCEVLYCIFCQLASLSIFLLFVLCVFYISWPACWAYACSGSLPLDLCIFNCICIFYTCWWLIKFSLFRMWWFDVHRFPPSVTVHFSRLVGKASLEQPAVRRHLSSISWLFQKPKTGLFPLIVTLFLICNIFHSGLAVLDLVNFKSGPKGVVSCAIK